MYGIPVAATGAPSPQVVDANGCEAGRLSVDILPRGTVVSCNYLGDDPRWICGNIREEPFSEIVRRLEVSNTLRHLEGNSIAQCASCQWNLRCGKGCRAVAFNYGGTLESRDPVCSGNKG